MRLLSTLFLWIKDFFISSRDASRNVNNLLGPKETAFDFRFIIEVWLFWIESSNKTLHNFNRRNRFDSSSSIKLTCESGSFILFDVSLMSHRFLNTPVNNLGLYLFFNSLIGIVFISMVPKGWINHFGFFLLIIKCLKHLAWRLFDSHWQLVHKLELKLFFFSKSPSSCQAIKLS